jgi:hypothetical protein
MPYSSNKQRRYMNWAASKGKIKQSIVNEFNKESKGMDLPERSKKAKKEALKRLRSK